MLDRFLWQIDPLVGVLGVCFFLLGILWARYRWYVPPRRLRTLQTDRDKEVQRYHGLKAEAEAAAVVEHAEKVTTLAEAPTVAAVAIAPPVEAKAVDVEPPKDSVSQDPVAEEPPVEDEEAVSTEEDEEGKEAVKPEPDSTEEPIPQRAESDEEAPEAGKQADAEERDADEDSGEAVTQAHADNVVEEADDETGEESDSEPEEESRLKVLRPAVEKSTSPVEEKSAVEEERPFDPADEPSGSGRLALKPLADKNAPEEVAEEGVEPAPLKGSVENVVDGESVPSSGPADVDGAEEDEAGSDPVVAGAADTDTEPDSEPASDPAEPESDDKRSALSGIDGLDVSAQNALVQMGVTNLQQLAEMDDKGLARISAVLDVSLERIQSEGWVDQARAKLGLPVVVPTPGPEATVDEPAEEPQPVEKPVVDVPIPEPKPPSPATPGAANDLTAIEGIGPATEKLLNLVGVSTFEQIARLTEAEKADLAVQLELESRIDEDQWVEQARRLAGMQDVTVAVGPPTDMDPPDAASYAPVKALFKSEPVEVDLELGVIYTAKPDHDDDLTLISGLGEEIQGELNTCGIYCYRQIAHWNAYNVHEFSRRLASGDRIAREEWVKQAKGLQLVCPKHTF